MSTNVAAKHSRSRLVLQSTWKLSGAGDAASLIFDNLIVIKV